MLASHAAMLVGMLVLMLVRRADDAHAGSCHAADHPQIGPTIHAAGETR
jgi:hypothetical protein